MLQMAVVFLVIGPGGGLAWVHHGGGRVDCHRQDARGIVPAAVPGLPDPWRRRLHGACSIDGLIQWKISAARDLPLNARPLPLLTVTATIALFVTLAVGAGEPVGGAAAADAALEGRTTIAGSHAGRRSGVRCPRRPGRRLSAGGSRRSRRHHRLLQRQDDHPDAGTGAGVRLGTAGVAARRANTRRRTPMARAGRVRQPRARADLRHKTRSPETVAAADCRRHARAAHHRSLRSAGRVRAPDRRRDTAIAGHGHAGRRSPDHQVRRRCARRLQPAVDRAGAEPGDRRSSG